MSASTPSTVPARPGIGYRVVAAVTLLVAFTFAFGDVGTVSAHTGFESSTPSDGAVVEEPVSTVTVVFTGEAKPVGDEFVALTADGVVQEAISIDTTDSKAFTVGFDPPLSGGRVGIRWNVQAADAHPIEGAFSFTVNTLAPTSPPPTSTASASSTVPASEVGTSTPTAADQGVVDESDPAVAATSTQSLDEFLEVDESAPGETMATVGRVVGFLGVALGLGAFAFVGTALQGRRKEVRNMLTAVRALGWVITIGAAIEYVGVSRIGGESLLSAWSTAPGFATVLRILGGVGIAAGVAGTISRGRVERLMRRPSVVRSLSAAVAEDIATPGKTPIDDSPVVRWTPDARSWPALGGTALIIASFWFDGHTVSKGFWPLHVLVNSVHVAAGAVWVGGIVSMAVIVWSRYRSDSPMRVVELVVRFSKIATIALGSVIVAGVVMAYLVLDSFGELTGTVWGEILLLKTAAVVLAMAGGAYNHFRLLPALEGDPQSPELLAELRATVTAEAIMLVFVVMVTAWLVAAAS